MTEPTWAERQARLTTAWKGLSAIVTGEDFDEAAVFAAELARNQEIERQVDREIAEGKWGPAATRGR